MRRRHSSQREQVGLERGGGDGRRRAVRPRAQRLLVGVPGLRHSSASLSSVRARLIRLLTVPLGMPSSAAASRVVSPSRTVAWTTARSSGERRREGDPHVAVLDPGQHLLLGRRRRVAAQVAQALEDVGAGPQLVQQGPDGDAPQPRAPPRPRPATPGACARRRGTCPGPPVDDRRVGAPPRQPGGQPRLVAHEELVQRTPVGVCHGGHQLRVGPVVDALSGVPAVSSTPITSPSCADAHDRFARAATSSHRSRPGVNRTTAPGGHHLVAARSVRRRSHVMEGNQMSKIRTGVGGSSRACRSARPPRSPAGVLVDHGHGPTVVHDTAYDQIKTQVHAWSSDGSTRVRLMVTGLPAGPTFGAHVHTRACGADPLASGGHYQHSATRRSRSPSGRSGSTSPRTNEVEASPRPRCRGRSCRARRARW